MRNYNFPENIPDYLEGLRHPSLVLILGLTDPGTLQSIECPCNRSNIKVIGLNDVGGEDATEREVIWHFKSVRQVAALQAVNVA